MTAGERADITASIQRSTEAYKMSLDSVQGNPDKQTITTEGAGGHCEFFNMPYTPGIQAMIDQGFETFIKAELQAGL